MSGVYWVLMCGGFQSSQVFDSEVEALAKAMEMSRMSGKLWVPRKIYY